MRTGARTFDLDDDEGLNFQGVGFCQLERVTVSLTLEALGSANSMINISRSILDGAWAVERLAAQAGSVRCRTEGYFGRKLVAVFDRPGPRFGQALDDVALILADPDDENETREPDRFAELCYQIGDFEAAIPGTKPRCAEIVDWYLSNLIGANAEWRSESPDYVRDQFVRFPERRYRYFKSSRGHELGGACYASQDSWLLSAGVDLDAFFVSTEQKYRRADFEDAILLAVGNGLLVCGESQVVEFPLEAFLLAAACIDAVERAPDDEDLEFDPPRPPDVTGLLNGRGRCLLHISGAMVIVETARYRLLFYGVKRRTASTLAKQVAGFDVAHQRLAAAAGLSQSIRCPWDQLTDEAFEELCYDIIRLHPDIDSETVRKLGKSRSRDGGRDIEAYEVRRQPESPPFKWIFQCKLVTNGSSLGATRLRDVGDMLEQYGAQGFGVMTSAPIDATLYDKLDAVCGGRNVRQRNYSIYELEREVLARSVLRARYFKA